MLYCLRERVYVEMTQNINSYFKLVSVDRYMYEFNQCNYAYFKSIFIAIFACFPE